MINSKEGAIGAKKQTRGMGEGESWGSSRIGSSDFKATW
jgi:hypothetical protein